MSHAEPRRNNGENGAGLAESLHLVFWGIVLLGIVTLAIAWSVPEMERADTAEAS